MLACLLPRLCVYACVCADVYSCEGGVCSCSHRLRVFLSKAFFLFYCLDSLRYFICFRPHFLHSVVFVVPLCTFAEVSLEHWHFRSTSLFVNIQI